MPIVALLLLSAQVARTPTPVTPPLTRDYSVCAGVRVLAPNLATQPRNLIFSSRQVLDLQFQARVRRDLPGDHLMQFKVFTPGGFLYQVITVPFVGSAPDAREPAARSRSGRRGACRGPAPAPLRPGLPAAAGRAEAGPRGGRRDGANALRGEGAPARGRDLDHPELAVRALERSVVPRRPAGPLRPGQPIHDPRLGGGRSGPLSIGEVPMTSACRPLTAWRHLAALLCAAALFAPGPAGAQPCTTCARTSLGLAPRSYAAGDAPVAAAAADLNRDGRADLVVANDPAGAGKIRVLLGGPNGFVVAGSYDAVSRSPRCRDRGLRHRRPARRRGGGRRRRLGMGADPPEPRQRQPEPDPDRLAERRPQHVRGRRGRLRRQRDAGRGRGQRGLEPGRRVPRRRHGGPRTAATSRPSAPRPGRSSPGSSTPTGSWTSPSPARATTRCGSSSGGGNGKAVHRGPDPPAVGDDAGEHRRGGPRAGRRPRPRDREHGVDTPSRSSGTRARAPSAARDDPSGGRPADRRRRPPGRRQPEARHRDLELREPVGEPAPRRRPVRLRARHPSLRAQQPAGGRSRGRGRGRPARHRGALQGLGRGRRPPRPAPRPSRGGALHGRARNRRPPWPSDLDGDGDLDLAVANQLAARRCRSCSTRARDPS